MSNIPFLSTHAVFYGRLVGIVGVRGRLAGEGGRRLGRLPGDAEELLQLVVLVGEVEVVVVLEKICKLIWDAANVRIMIGQKIGDSLFFFF